MKHGADIFEYSEDGRLTDFSSNINPLGPPPGIYEQIINDVGNIKRYPDIKYRSLYGYASTYLGVGEDELLLGNGAMEVIDACIASCNRIAIVEPCFSEYEERARARGKEIIRAYYDEKFLLSDLEFLNQLRDGDLLILTNPNNPTGKSLDGRMLMHIAAECEKRGARLLLDEAFYEFADLDYNSVELIKRFKNLFVIRAATKFFSLPGLRLGMLVSDSENISALKPLILTWSVGSLMENLGRLIFCNKAFILKSQAYIKRERERMFNALCSIDKLEPVESNANYILVKLCDITEDEIFTAMLKKKILIRRCSSYNGLNGEYIRLAVRSAEDNDFLIQALSEYAGGDTGDL